MIKNVSIWQNIKLPQYPKLESNTDADILIIGGGITGLNLFYALKNLNKKIILVEKNKLGLGATIKSSAKITYLQQNIYSSLYTTFGLSKTKLYYEALKDAIKEYENIIKKENIVCDFERVPSYIYAWHSNEVKTLKKEEKILTLMGIPHQSKDKALKVEDTYVFHPLKYLKGLLKTLTNKLIYEDTNIDQIVLNEDKTYTCYTKKFYIKAKIVIIASHYPNFIWPYLFPLKCFLEKSTLIASASVNQKYSAINFKKPINSLRFWHNYQINVGMSHNMALNNNDYQNYLNLKKILDLKDTCYTWTNYDVMTLDKLPLIGLIKDNLYLATGYNTWGMTGSMIASLVLRDLILGKENKYKALFDPKRSLNKAKLINFPIPIFSNTYAFLSSKIIKNKDYYQKNPYFTTINGKRVGIYKDNDGYKHIVYNKCPHLKCSLIFNKQEQTWECPCHGSKFDLDGHVLYGPSNDNITFGE